MSKIQITSKYYKSLTDKSVSRVLQNEIIEFKGSYNYQGVDINFLDMSTLSPVGTFKDVIATFIAAYCLDHHIGEIVTQTSGNTGNALAYYTKDLGIKLTVFYPKTSRYKINAQLANLPHCRFIEVDGTEKELKDLTLRYSESNNIPWLPTFTHQVDANKIRAFFINDYINKSFVKNDWHVQSISSAFGPIGFYKGLHDLSSGSSSISFPKFLGVQQSSVKPFYNYLNNIKDNENIRASTLEPTLFRSRPSNILLEEIRKICNDTNGTIRVVDLVIYNKYLELALDIFTKFDMHLTLRADNSDYQEKAALIALIGLLDAADNNIIKKGESALLSITGGFAKKQVSIYNPRIVIKDIRNVNVLKLRT